MPYSADSTLSIYNRMKASVEQELNKTNWLSRNFILGTYGAISTGMHLMHEFLVKISKDFSIFTASFDELKRQARAYAIPWKEPLPSVGVGIMTGLSGTIIPADTRIQIAETGVVYKTDQSETVESTGVVFVEFTALEKGENGNASVTTMELVTSIPNIDDTVIISTQPSGGYDGETKNELLNRILQRKQNPPGSGNKNDYNRWALASGAGISWVLSGDEWLGTGTVAIVVATTDFQSVDSATKTEIENYIESVRPAGADNNSVEDPDWQDTIINVSVKPNTTDLQTLCNLNISDLFYTSSEPGGTLKISQLRKAIANTGYDDYKITSITVNGSSVPVDDISTVSLETLRFQKANYSLLS